MPPEPTDFIGTLEHFGNICEPCPPDFSGKETILVVQNVTNHPIDLSPSSPRRVGFVCGIDMTASGQLATPMVAQTGAGRTLVQYLSDAEGGWRGSGAVSSLPPGAWARSDQVSYSRPFPDDHPPGRVTCEAAILRSSDGSWNDDTLSVIAPIPDIAGYSFEVLPRAQATTSTSTTTTTVTSPPTSATP